MGVKTLDALYEITQENTPWLGGKSRGGGAYGTTGEATFKESNGSNRQKRVGRKKYGKDEMDKKDIGKSRGSRSSSKKILDSKNNTVNLYKTY